MCPDPSCPLDTLPRHTLLQRKIERLYTQITLLLLQHRKFEVTRRMRNIKMGLTQVKNFTNFDS